MVIAIATRNGVITVKCINKVIACTTGNIIGIVGAKLNDPGEVFFANLIRGHTFECDAVAGIECNNQIAIGIGAEHVFKAAEARDAKRCQIDNVAVDIKIGNRVMAITRIKDDLIGTGTQC